MRASAIIVCFVFVSCEPAFVDVPQDASLLSVNSVFFNSDSVFWIRVGPSYPIVGEVRLFDKVIDNALVRITDARGQVMLASFEPTGSSEGFYKTSTKPEIGLAYSLVVSAPGYPTARATATLPDPTSISEIKIDSVSIKRMLKDLAEDPDSYDLSAFTFCDISFHDPNGVKNYYEIRAYLNEEWYETDVNGQPILRTGTVEMDIFSKDPAVDDIVDTSGTPDPNEVVFDDTRFDGEVQSVRISLYTAPFCLPSTREIIIVLRSLSPDYFHYFKTLNLQRSAEDDPFSQPVQVFNNIEDGLGNFGGYSQSVFSLKRR